MASCRFLRESSLASSILILRDLQLFAQYDRFFGSTDADLGALRRYRQQLYLDIVADHYAFARAAAQH